MTAKAVAVAVPIILLLVGTLFGLSWLLTASLGLPASLDFPLVVRAGGALVVLVGLAFAGWTFRYRTPVDMIVSTYVTFTKLFRVVPLAERAGRTEPLVILGPQKYTRNPLYFGVVVMVFGWALVGAYTFVLMAAVLLLLWFRLFLIPFEERELRALFGVEYQRYSDDVPVLVPFTKRKR